MNNKVIKISYNSKRTILYGLPIRILSSGSKGSRLVAEPYVQLSSNPNASDLANLVFEKLDSVRETIQDPLNFSYYKDDFFNKLGIKSFNQLDGFPINIVFELNGDKIIVTPWIKSKQHKGLVPLEQNFIVDNCDEEGLMEAINKAEDLCKEK